MFVQLIESQARPHKRVGGSLASVVVHAAVIGSAIVLTANAGIVKEEEAVQFVEQFVKVNPPPTQPLSAPVASSRAPRGATMAVRPAVALSLSLPAIVDIPITVPPVNANARDVTVDDFARGTGGYGEGGAGGISNDGVGNGNVFSAAQVDKPVIMRPGTKAPLYPELLQRSGVVGEVMVQFVVDTLGLVDMGTLRVITSDHELFTSAVRSSMAHMRFLPAELRGKKVPQLVRQPFRFDLIR